MKRVCEDNDPVIITLRNSDAVVMISLEDYEALNEREIPWDDNTFDVVWGEDSWCYVNNKEILIKEAERVLKPGGTLAFSDWIEGSAGLTEEEAEHLCNSKLGMTFPYLETLKGYEDLIAKYGLRLVSSEDLNFFKGFFKSKRNSCPFRNI